MDRYINEALKVYEQRQKSYLNKAERGGNAAGALNQGRTSTFKPGNKVYNATIQGKLVRATPQQIKQWNANTTEEQRNDPNFLPDYAKQIISQGGRSTASIMREQGKVWNQKLRRYVDAPKKTEAPKTTTGATTTPKPAPGQTTVGSNTGKKVWNPKTNTYDTVKETPKTKPTTKPKTTTPKAKPATPKAKPAAKPKTNTKKETSTAKPEAKPKTKPATGGFVTEDMLETKSQPTIKALQIRNERLYATGEITKSDYLLTRLRIERIAKANKGALPQGSGVSEPDPDQTKEGQATQARIRDRREGERGRANFQKLSNSKFSDVYDEESKAPYNPKKALLKLRKERFQYEERLRDDSDPITPVKPLHTGEGSKYVGSHGRKLGDRKNAEAAAATGKETTNRGVKRRNNSSGPGLSIADRLRRDKE